MIRGYPLRGAVSRFWIAVFLCLLVAFALQTALPLCADEAGGKPSGNEDFGQYLADHQEELAPFFTKNAGDLLKMAVPLFMSMLGGVIVFTMLLGWGLDVLMSRGYAYFFAPAFGDWKRSVVYATGRLFLSFLYTCLISLAVVICLGLTHSWAVVVSAITVFLLVALAAQIVWILYLYRTGFSLSIGFYFVLAMVHIVAGVLLMQPLMGTHAPIMATNFIDRAITPRLQTDADEASLQSTKAKVSRDEVKNVVLALQEQTLTSQAEQEHLRQQIEEKKNSDIYILAQIIKARASGDLVSAREQLTAFPGRFPASPLDALAQEQLGQINQQINSEVAQKKQQDADMARQEAQARAALLAQAAKGQATLSEMRSALIGKTRAQVEELLGKPTETEADAWGYNRQMIVNPITNERQGLKVYFSVGIVQGLDYASDRRTQ